jgi:hypothetical protein
MDDHIIELTAAVSRIEAKVESIDRGVNGNGQPGLKQRVEDLEASKNRMWGMGTAGAFLLGVAEYLFHRGGK